MSDPNFPDRPNHPDFWLISQVLIDTDAQMDNNTSPFEDTVGRVVDPKTLLYVAQQRGIRSGIQNPGVRMKLEAAWMDAFMAGAQFQALKIRKAHAEDDGVERLIEEEGE